jgi:hypothetical protein
VYSDPACLNFVTAAARRGLCLNRRTNKDVTPMSDGLSHELPLDRMKTGQLVALLAFWEARRGSRSMPSRTDFDVIDLKPWLGNLHLLDVEGGGREFRYRVYGSVLAEYFGHDFTGKTTAAVRPEAREIVRGEYRAVCREQRPIFVHRQRDVSGGEVRVERLVLPLSSDGASVDKLMVCSYPLGETIGDDLG